MSPHVAATRLRALGILLIGVISLSLGPAACEGDSKKQDKSSPAPAQDGKGASPLGADPKQKVEFEDPALLPQKVSIKAYHLLVKEGGNDFSGYCIALNKDPKLGTDAGDTIVVKRGGCPASLSIKGKSSPMTFVCNPVELTKEVTQQVVLYSQLETGGSYKDIKTLDPEIIRGFCANPQAS